MIGFHPNRKYVLKASKMKLSRDPKTEIMISYQEYGITTTRLEEMIEIRKIKRCNP